MPLNKHAISHYLNETSLNYIKNIRIENSLTSTNTHLLAEIKSQQKEVIVLLAEEQTAARGRLGRSWIAPKNKNIYLSLSWHFNKPVSALSGLSLVIGIAILRALAEITGAEKIKIKWPNDILFDDKKLAGILIETISAKSTCAAVIGIGLNVNFEINETDKIDQPWTSLSQITKTEHDRNIIVASILNALCEILPEFEENGLKNFMTDWQNSDVLFEKQCRIKSGNEIKSGIAQGINNQGELLLKINNNIEAVNSGELLPNGTTLKQ
ncbi:MAG: biotin--[acetyl-CoA-carboxylase] ligase [Gammaproteobacteria bacterium]|nr:biotin--[acetyl-CoA-carboxylase] ligase [Gammaproteobacteria bacterium]